MTDPDEGAQQPDASAPEPEVPDLEIPEAEVPELDQPEPAIPEAVLPESFLAEPVIPPPPAETPVTRADWREKWQDRSGAPDAPRAGRRAASGLAAAPKAPASDPRLTAPEPDPAVVPPPSGATSGGYRGLTIAIYGFLGVLLVGAVVLISTLLS
ncbi:hypothetical protein [Microbacterium suwonense]|uniref:Uncharacterized protein n=1 Tax=Microbacterium suwonense TaxID=683047 RepID=A0ABM8FWQ4_9MICO|nr:hypothetical protein [Microbacterium suwonense]BDZ40159.1 hypothetical protein GCM10025863_27730 [Microbacterium suwonense]